MVCKSGAVYISKTTQLFSQIRVCQRVGIEIKQLCRRAGEDSLLVSSNCDEIFTAEVAYPFGDAGTVYLRENLGHVSVRRTGLGLTDSCADWRG